MLFSHNLIFFLKQNKNQKVICYFSLKFHQKLLVEKCSVWLVIFLHLSGQDMFFYVKLVIEIKNIDPPPPQSYKIILQEQTFEGRTPFNKRTLLSFRENIWCFLDSSVCNLL